MDPLHAFAAYPTRTLTPQTPLALVDADGDTALARTLAMVDFAKAILTSEPEIEAVLQAAAGELVAGLRVPRPGVAGQAGGAEGGRMNILLVQQNFPGRFKFPGAQAWVSTQSPRPATQAMSAGCD